MSNKKELKNKKINKTHTVDLKNINIIANKELETKNNLNPLNSIDTTPTSSMINEYIEEGDFCLDTRNLDNLSIKPDKFQKGIDKYSEFAGSMSVLVSMGISSLEALAFLEREAIRKHELDKIKLDKSLE